MTTNRQVPVDRLRALGARVAGALGHDHPLVLAGRPLYQLALEIVTAGRGIAVTVSGLETFQVSPWVRDRFPPEWEPDVMTTVHGLVRRGDTCWNVGANVGVYTLCLARWCAPDGRVVAFEPNPYARRVLQRHLRLNGLAAGVDVRAEAVSDEPGTLVFHATGTDGMSRPGVPNPLLRRSRRLMVPVTTIDAMVALLGRAPDVLVMDIEGYELAALSAARAAFGAGGIRHAVVELHPEAWPGTGWTRERGAALLADLRLRPEPLTGQRDPLSEHGTVILQPTGAPRA